MIMFNLKYLKYWIFYTVLLNVQFFQGGLAAFKETDEGFLSDMSALSDQREYYC